MSWVEWFFNQPPSLLWHPRVHLVEPLYFFWPPEVVNTTASGRGGSSQSAASPVDPSSNIYAVRFGGGIAIGMRADGSICQSHTAREGEMVGRGEQANALWVFTPAYV